MCDLKDEPELPLECDRSFGVDPFEKWIERVMGSSRLGPDGLDARELLASGPGLGKRNIDFCECSEWDDAVEGDGRKLGR